MTHAEARAIVTQAWRRIHGTDPSDLQASYTQAIAWLENQYGRAGQFANLAANGQFNWGSLHARGTPPNCPAGSAAGVDVRPVCFQVFPTDLDAATAFVRVLTKQQWPTVSAMQGTPEDVATAMRVPPAYFEGDAKLSEAGKISSYANLIRRGLADVAKGAPVPPIPSRSAASSLVVLALLGAAGYGMYRLAGNPLPQIARLIR
jgi:hypothetical protein